MKATPKKPFTGVAISWAFFHKISRFIDVPNVLSKLENISIKKTEPLVIPTEPEKIKQIYDKKSLLEKVIDFFKMNS